VQEEQMTERKQTQPKDYQPDEFDADLRPTPEGAGINHGELGANPERDAPNAEVITELHKLLPDFTRDELRRMVVLQPGDVLEQGATYIDLRHPRRGEFTAEKPEQVGRLDLNLFIPKQQTDYELWNRLRGVDDPQRTGGAG
jgi:hypothetical protein